MRGEVGVMIQSVEEGGVLAGMEDLPRQAHAGTFPSNCSQLPVFRASARNEGQHGKESTIPDDPAQPALPPEIPRSHRGRSHKQNPLSNPEDRAHYLSRVRKEVGRKGGLALGKPAEMRERKLPADVTRRPGHLSLASQIGFGPLRAWMQSYGVWLLMQHPAPGMDKRLERIRFLTKKPATMRNLKMLESRVDFQDFVERLTEDAAERAKAEYREMFPLMSEAQRVALEAAIVDPKAYKNIAKVVEGMTDRIWPKKAPEADTKKVVHLHISGKQAEAIAAAETETVIPEAEIEVIDPTKNEPTTAER